MVKSYAAIAPRRQFGWDRLGLNYMPIDTVKPQNKAALLSMLQPGSRSSYAEHSAAFRLYGIELFLALSPVSYVASSGVNSR